MKNKKFIQSIALLVVGILLNVSNVCGQNTLPAKSAELAQKFISKDTLFKAPYIDMDEIREKPINHRCVHGGFKGTNTKFSFYFPTKENYKGRFFQYITPVPDSETLSQGASGEEDKISFSITHGAYFIETNGGGAMDMSNPMKADATIGAYKANAASAQFSRVITNEIFGGKRPFGYAFGGSGGAYRTIGGAENTTGVWDGTVPFVAGSPMAIPNVFSVRMHAMRVLQHKLPQIVDALEPGGSGDMYAGLNEEEKAALMEATKMGFPKQAWFNYKNMGIHAFPAIYGGMRMADGAYFTDFWTKKGYLGFDNPASFTNDRLKEKAVITKIITKKMAYEMGLGTNHEAGRARGSADLAWKNITPQADTIPLAFQVSIKLKKVQFLGGELNLLSGLGKGKDLALKSVDGDLVMLGETDPNLSSKVRVNDEVEIDNSNYLAAQTYHKHQVPSAEYKVWDQFRDAAGKPIYPQRPMIIGPLFTRFTVGSLPKGKFDGKMILLGSLWDTEAYAWQSDWYSSQVKKQLGDGIDDKFRLYFTDHANHGDNATESDHFVSYLGVLQQALLDLSDWVEKGIAPAKSTNYKVEEGQIVLPETANERAGLQPMINLKVNGSKRADIKVGKSVSFEAEIEVPANTGQIVSAEWNFEGAKTYEVKTTIVKGSKVIVKGKHIFTEAGTFFPTLRIASQREGDEKTPFTRIVNLDRVRVVVK